MNYEQPTILTKKETRPSIQKIEDIVPFLKTTEGRQNFNEDEINKFIEAKAALAEQLGYEVLRNDSSQWFRLKKDNYIIRMQYYMSPADTGYHNGRIAEFIVVNEINPSEHIFAFYGEGEDKVLESKDISKKDRIELKNNFDQIVKYFN